jgi:hypothetical protein
MDDRPWSRACAGDRAVRCACPPARRSGSRNIHNTAPGCRCYGPAEADRTAGCGCCARRRRALRRRVSGPPAPPLLSILSGGWSGPPMSRRQFYKCGTDRSKPPVAGRPTIPSRRTRWRVEHSLSFAPKETSLLPVIRPRRPGQIRAYRGENSRIFWKLPCPKHATSLV